MNSLFRILSVKDNGSVMSNKELETGKVCCPAASTLHDKITDSPMK